MAFLNELVNALCFLSRQHKDKKVHQDSISKVDEYNREIDLMNNSQKHLYMFCSHCGKYTDMKQGYTNTGDGPRRIKDSFTLYYMCSNNCWREWLKGYN
jgi:phage terminase large subunit GpA-like protein